MKPYAFGIGQMGDEIESFQLYNIYGDHPQAGATLAAENIEKAGVVIGRADMVKYGMVEGLQNEITL